VSASLSKRYIGLYYASLDIKRAFVLIAAWIASPFISRQKAETELANAVWGELGKGEVFAYASARGSLAAVLRAAGVGKGDEVVLSGFTCLAVPTAVVALDAKPVYVDINPSSLNTDAAAVVASFGARVRAVVLQHTMGSLVDVSSVVEAARKRGIVVIEDCALATGSRRQGVPVGIDGDAAIFSMELSKTISTGWGGILVVQNPTLAKLVRQQDGNLSDRGIVSITRDVWQIALSAVFLDRRLFRWGRYAYAIAFKFRLFRGSTPTLELEGKAAKDFTARMGLPQVILAAHQWCRLTNVREVSGGHVRALQAALQTAGLMVAGIAPPGIEPVSPRVCFLVNDRKQTMAWFYARGIEVGQWFDGPLSPPPSADVFAYTPDLLPQAVQIANKIVNLPSHCGMTTHDCNRLIELIHEYATDHPVDRINK
jgi:dTDP-4-amino-4,6-dideoxygalactose transaminase